MGVVQANNELKELEAKEEQEILRILSALSAEASKYSGDILWDYDVLVHLDVIFAKAQLSYKMEGMRPEIRKKRLPGAEKGTPPPAGQRQGGAH